jgi:hypothetical protein
MSAPWWTEADSAELDVLVWELSRRFAEHRELCEACSPHPCPVLAEWRRHLAVCAGCRGDYPLSARRCEQRYRAFVDHGATCKRCNPCPALRKAIAVVVEWRELRELLSRAEHLRAERDRIGAAA